MARLPLIITSAALVLSGCGATASPGAQPESSSSPEPTVSDPTPPSPGCGDPFAVRRGPLDVTASFERVDAKVSVTAQSKVKGVTTGMADAYVVKSGKVVALPLPRDLMARPVDLAEGAKQELAAEASAQGCDGKPLPAGRYEVYVVVTVVADDGSKTESTGGPWALDLP